MITCTKHAVLVILFAGLFGCGVGNGEKFVAPSASSFGLASHNGKLWIVPGNALLDGHTMGPQKNLLYLLVVCPGLAASGSGTATDYQQRSNSYISHWETQNGKVSVAFHWDRRTDRVSIGELKFSRPAGSTFIAVRQPNGAVTVTQLPSPGKELDARNALQFIQKQMTNDVLISTIRLLKSN